MAMMEFFAHLRTALLAIFAILVTITVLWWMGWIDLTLKRPVRSGVVYERQSVRSPTKKAELADPVNGWFSPDDITSTVSSQVKDLGDDGYLPEVKVQRTGGKSYDDKARSDLDMMVDKLETRRM